MFNGKLKHERLIQWIQGIKYMRRLKVVNYLKLKMVTRFLWATSSIITKYVIGFLNIFLNAYSCEYQ